MSKDVLTPEVLTKAISAATTVAIIWIFFGPRKSR